MAALVSSGAIATGTSSSLTNLAYGQTPTAGNTLFCWAVASRSSGTASITTPSGWTLVNSIVSSSFVAAAFIKTAAGGDAAPTISASSATNMKAQLSEWSGIDPTNPIGSSGTASTTTGGSVTPTASAITPNAGVAITVGGHKVSTAATTTHTPATGWTSLGLYVASNAVHAAADYDLTPDTVNPVSEAFAFGTGTATTLGIVVVLNSPPSSTGSGSGSDQSSTASGSGTASSTPSRSWTPLQSASAQATSGSSLSATFPNPVTPGSLLVAALVLDGRQTSVNLTGVVDTINSSTPGWDFTTLTANDGTSNTRAWLAFLPNSAGGSCTVTMNMSAASDGSAIAIGEFAGIDTISPLFDHNVLTWTSGTSTETLPAITAQEAGDLILVAACPGSTNTPSAGTGFTADVALINFGSGNNNGILLEHGSATGTTGNVATFNQSSTGHHGSAIVASFKLASSSPPSTGSGSGSAPIPRASGTGTSTPPHYTGSGSGRAGSPHASGSAISIPPSFKGSGTGRANNPTATGTGTGGVPSYRGSGAAQSKNAAASGTGAAIPPDISGSGSARDPRPQATGSGTRYAPAEARVGPTAVIVTKVSSGSVIGPSNSGLVIGPSNSAAIIPPKAGEVQISTSTNTGVLSTPNPVLGMEIVKVISGATTQGKVNTGVSVG